VADSYEFETTDWVSAGAVGRPGQRVFYVQARSGEEFVALVAEKEQVRALAQLAQELLGRIDVVVTPDDLDEEGYRTVDPPIPGWRIGALSLGMDSEGERFLLEADEFVPDEEEQEPATARFWLTREQLIGLAAYAAWAVEAGARETCRLCGRPVDPVEGHVCPASNGHGPLSR
jgi:uncharacterized repeat protein (TIGR03847 family)